MRKTRTTTRATTCSKSTRASICTSSSATSATPCRRCVPRVDTWFLDGFAPAKNPDCWTPALMQEIARHSAPDATIATFSAAAAVRDALSQAGFTPGKIPGYGAKRDMLTATLTTPPAPRPHWNNQPAAADGPIVIIGAGIAGSTTARALAESGRRVTLYHSDAHPAASHVPLAVPYLNPDSEASPDRPYQLATWHHAMRALHQYPRDIYNPCGVTNHAENPREIRRQQTLLDVHLLSADEIGGNATDLTYPARRRHPSARPARRPCRPPQHPLRNPHHHQSRRT
ncbi:FAD-dependent oxidoreductase [Cardiobacterium valvarum]|uniref:FAD-dependent oxidoreductase n=1 Tax=Cardiobacterium valvarum TaxID=194702 RepID=UPI0035E85CAB